MIHHRQFAAGVIMRGTDETSGSLFSYVDLEDRIPARHPLRKIRRVVNDALASLDEDFDRLYVDFGRPSIAPERLIRASLLQILFSIRSERQLMEQMQYNLLFRWFVGLGIDDPVWVPTVFSQHRARLLTPALSRKVMEADVMNIGFCPYDIFVMQLPESDEVTVGYRAFPESAMQEVQTLLDTIVKEAIGE